MKASNLIIILFVILIGCIPTRQKCLELYPQQSKDTIITTHDTIAQPFIITLPGDTIRIDSKIDKPCPDSIKQWAKFTTELNYLLNKDKRLKQTFNLTKDSLKYTAITAKDSIKGLNKIILIQNDRITTLQQAVIAYQNKVPSWVWYVLGGLVLILFIETFIIIVKK